MKFICKELKNKEFNSREKMIKYILKNKDEILSIKKATLKETDSVSLVLIAKEAQKQENSKELKLGDVIPAVINTINYLDSHGDLHVNGIWNKSAKEQNGKTHHIINHDLSLGNIVGYPADVEVAVETVSWKDLGVDSAGTTEILIFYTRMTERTNKDAFLAYKGGIDIQHSVRMQYIDISLAADTDDPEYESQKKRFDKYLPQIINSEVAVERGYFYVVKIGKIVKEGSTVLFGSNKLTPALYNRIKSEPLQDTQNKEPLKDTLMDYEKMMGFSFNFKN